MWDPPQYLRFGDERSRPFVDLVARVPTADARSVVDLGCGPGNLTATLARRWPGASITGVDSSRQMIDVAQRDHEDGALRFVLAEVDQWLPPGPVDVVVSNATLHWLPGHASLLRRFAGWVAPGGSLAMQVPGNFRAASHRAIADACASPRWADRLGHLAVTDDDVPVLEPAEYAEVLADAGLAVDVWETTYLHLLAGPDPVLEWVKGSAMRPVLARLGEADSGEFCADVAARLRAAYPPGRHGTAFPFRRIFAVGHRSL